MCYIHTVEYSVTETEKSTDTHYNIDEPCKHDVKGKSQLQNVTYVASLLYEISRIGKFKKTERLWLPEAAGRREWGVISHQYGISFWSDESILN